MKRNIYLAQINYLHGKSTFLPYAVGTLIANAKAQGELADFYDFKEPIFIREDPVQVLDRLENPFLVGFSNYIWNHEYNKILAKMVKERYPDCIILFGGHHVAPDSGLLENEEYIDVLSFGEGEETFAALLKALKDNRPLSEVFNIAYRDGKNICRSAEKYIEGVNYPSPYLTGVFDSIIESHPDIEFHAIIETNRGCPFKCAYCDWGYANGKVRLFSEEKVMQELKWFSDHNISGFGVGDANFGMYERDERITDEIVRLHNEEGVLSRCQVSSAKNSNERVFSISKKFNDCKMDKGATLSFQSLSPIALENIGRKNIPVEMFTSLLNKYNVAGIPTYSELILGLPGETCESFIKGVDTLLNAGQHYSIYIHDCEWLPCAEMGAREYTQKHGIETVLVPLNEPHTIIDSNDEITEFSRLVVETNSMTRADWVKMNIFSVTVQAYHHGGLLMLIAMYLYHEKGVAYSSFYDSFISFALENPQTVIGDIFKKLYERYSAVAKGESGVVWEDRFFGDVGWLSEEFAYLNTVVEFDKFYSEIKGFLKSFFDDDELFEELFLYQQTVVKLPFKEKIDFACEYDFKNYFLELLCNNHVELKKKHCDYFVPQPIKCNDWKAYARYVVWYGRKDSRRIYAEEIEER